MDHDGGTSGCASVPIPESYWVRPGRFLAGEHPLSSNPDESFHRVSRLAEFGIRHVIDLTEPFEDKRFEYGQPSYDAFIGRVCVQRDITMTRSRFPIPDFGAPDLSLMIRILNDIDLSISENLPVYVHCRAGIGRTGMVVGCYLVRHTGMTGIAVLDTINSMRKSLLCHFIDSPQTREQIELVLSWREGAV